MAEISWQYDGHSVPIRTKGWLMFPADTAVDERLFQVGGAVHEVLFRWRLAVEFVTQEPAHMRLGAF